MITPLKKGFVVAAILSTGSLLFWTATALRRDKPPERVRLGEVTFQFIEPVMNPPCPQYGNAFNKIVFHIPVVSVLPARYRVLSSLRGAGMQGNKETLADLASGPNDITVEMSAEEVGATCLLLPTSTAYFSVEARAWRHEGSEDGRGPQSQAVSATFLLTNYAATRMESP